MTPKGGGEKVSGQAGKKGGWISRNRAMKGREGTEGRKKTKRGEHFAHPSLFMRPFPCRTAQTGNLSDQTFMSAAFLAGSVPD